MGAAHEGAAPVHPGDTITADLVVLKARDEKPIYTVQVRVTRQDGGSGDPNAQLARVYFLVYTM